MERRPTFYFDLASPACYLAAERVMSTLPVAPEWVPLLGLEPPEQLDRTGVEHAAEAQGLQPLRWPSPWPPNGRIAALAATYAKQIGRGVAFSLACFRQQFAGGRDIDDSDTVLIAAAACEMHPSAVLRALDLRSVQTALSAACQRAADAGITRLPAIETEGGLYDGDTAVEQAARALGAAA